MFAGNLGKFLNHSVRNYATPDQSSATLCAQPCKHQLSSEQQQTGHRQLLGCLKRDIEYWCPLGQSEWMEFSLPSKCFLLRYIWSQLHTSSVSSAHPLCCGAVRPGAGGGGNGREHRMSSEPTSHFGHLSTPVSLLLLLLCADLFPFFILLLFPFFPFHFPYPFYLYTSILPLKPAVFSLWSVSWPVGHVRSPSPRPSTLVSQESLLAASVCFPGSGVPYAFMGHEDWLLDDELPVWAKEKVLYFRRRLQK